MEEIIQQITNYQTALNFLNKKPVTEQNRNELIPAKIEIQTRINVLSLKKVLRANETTL